jgi:hypothetical protein
MDLFKDLSDQAAVKALSIVSIRWLQQRGVEAILVFQEASRATSRLNTPLPAWAWEKAEANIQSGQYARSMLSCLKNGTDDEISVWVDDAIKDVRRPQGHVLDPVTLSIVGIMLIGGILAARVKKIGSVEFYEGVPKELADVIKAGSGIVVPSGPIDRS